MAESTITPVVTASARDWLAQRVRDDVLERSKGPEQVRLAIAGGSVLDVMAQVVRLTPPDVWRRVALTLVDERVVPWSSPDSTWGASRDRAGADEAGAVLPMVLDGEAARTAWQRFRAGFHQHFRGGLDVVVLGMGEDGHVASLFPGHRLLDQQGLVAWLDDSPKPPPTRVTMLFDALNQPQTTRYLYAVGPAKRPALERLLRRDPTLPASRLADFTLVTDQPLEG
ncbi:MAG: 6-phosphogluconolactonase [Myxococcaceae bacterium]|nr:6-phosphogluconolactonase [Myxococcaceae bacterium]